MPSIVYEKKTPFITGYTNLMKSILGVGIISYPMLFQKLGICATLICLSISAMFSSIGLILYLFLNDKRNFTMSNLSGLKSVEYFVNFIILSKCISVSISYIITIRDIFYDIGLKQYIANILLVCTVLAIAPLSVIKTFKKLHITSFLGVFAVGMMVTVTLLRFSDENIFFKKKLITNKPVQTAVANVPFLAPQQNIQPLNDQRTVLNISSGIPKDLMFFCKSFGSFVYSFTCHQNIFAFSNECRMSFKSSCLCVFSVITSCIFLFIIFGFLNSVVIINMGNPHGESFFSCLPKDKYTLFIKIFFVFVVIFAVPLQLNAAQKCLNITNMPKRFLFCYAVHIIGLLITFSEINFTTVIKNIGGTVSAFLCHIIAGIYILYFIKRPDRNGQPYEITTKWRCLGISTLIFGIFVFIYTIFGIFPCFSRK